MPKSVPRHPEVIAKIKATKNSIEGKLRASLASHFRTEEFLSSRRGKNNAEFYGIEKAAAIAEKKSSKLVGKTHLEVLGSQERVDERNRKHGLAMAAVREERLEKYHSTIQKRWNENPPEDRNNPLYAIWRTEVLTRDNFTCQHCNESEHLHAHHIKKWCEYVELRYEVSNGLTLCWVCHRKEEARLKRLKRTEERLTRLGLSPI